MPGTSDSPFLLRLISYVVRGAGGLLVLAVAIGATWVLVISKPEPLRKPAAVKVVAVRAIEARPISIARAWVGYGTARAMRAADVTAQVPGRVIERPAAVEPGAPVRAGDTLVRLDPLDFEQRVAASREIIASWEAQISGLLVEERRLSDQLEYGEEELEFERRELARLTTAAEQGGVNAVEIERRAALVSRKEREIAALRQQLESTPARRAQMQAMVGNERAALRVAEENLDRATVRSPIDGRLQTVSANLGEVLSIGAPVARVVDLSRIEVPVRLPVSATGSIAVGDAAELGPDSDAPGRWHGRVSRIAPEADPGTRTLTVFVEVMQDPSERAGLLLPGQFVAARVTSSDEEDRFVVPRSAVNGDVVMVAENGEGSVRVHRRPVRVLFHVRRSLPRIDATETEWAVLESGLSSGERVVVTNIDDLSEGTTVQVQGAAVAADGGGGNGGGS